MLWLDDKQLYCVNLKQTTLVSQLVRPLVLQSYQSPTPLRRFVLILAQYVLTHVLQYPLCDAIVNRSNAEVRF
jgi:hypothetical protein